jgi:hypothetical protein
MSLLFTRHLTPMRPSGRIDGRCVPGLSDQRLKDHKALARSESPGDSSSSMNRRLTP